MISQTPPKRSQLYRPDLEAQEALEKRLEEASSVVEALNAFRDTPTRITTVDRLNAVHSEGYQVFKAYPDGEALIYRSDSCATTEGPFMFYQYWLRRADHGPRDGSVFDLGYITVRLKKNYDTRIRPEPAKLILPR